MKILVVHEVSYLSKIIYEYQILPEILSLLDHEVTVVDYDDTWQAARSSSTTLRTEIQAGVARAYPEAAITLRRPGMIRLPVISRISGAAFGTLEVMRILRRNKPDAVLLYALPTLGLQAVALAREFRVPVIFRAIDVSHELVPHPLLAPPTRALEGIVFNTVDLVAALTPHIRDYVRSYGVPQERIRLLPSGVDTKLFTPGPADPALRASWGIGRHDPVTLFMGTLYRFSGLDRLIRGFPRVLARHPEAKLLIVGGGEDEQRLKALAGPGVIFTGTLPYAMLPDLIRSSDLCINPFELNGVTERILPTKLFQYMACGKPVAATRLPGTLPFLSGEAQGVLYAPLDGFVDAVIALLGDQGRREALGRAGHATAQTYDWTAIAGTLTGWLSEMVERPPAPLR